MDLSYYIGDAPTGITQAEFETTIENALEVWSDVIDVTFTETSQPNEADSIDFTSQVIDGSGGILAQAYFPDDVNRGSIAGDVQFDSLDSWEIGNAEGYSATDLMHVAVHEIGHSLGLEHIADDDSVLAETVSPNESFGGLSQEDIDAAIALYAPAVIEDDPVVDLPAEETDTTPLEDVDDDDDEEVVDDDPASEDPTDEADDLDPAGDDGDADDPVDDSDDDSDDDESDEDEADDRERRRRFRRVMNFFVRRFRFSFWSQVSLFR
ncbi:matrixin family metalloprotease [Mariniblastus fucicola]|uniref:matrixin family metalloprotease n=1 Tax=Mariniblastus fucicola TaxID=980251 RepID=UPI0013905C99|nr:matrixin family metalloprotease [Mariniblastus fucicola]